MASGRHLLSLINDILDLSKVEAGRMELELAPFDLPAALENALTLVRERADPPRHRARARRRSRGWATSCGDERKVKQVLLNLLSNAVKFTPRGRPRRWCAAAPANGMVEVSVSDTGIGIAPEDQEAIFEEFRQVGTDYARKREGTGLGLSARQAVRRAARRPHLGEERGRARARPSRSPSGEESEAMAGELILIVEDNEKNRKLVRDVLSFKGYRTVEARDRGGGHPAGPRARPGAHPDGHPAARDGRHRRARPAPGRPRARAPSPSWP